MTRAVSFSIPVMIALSLCGCSIGISPTAPTPPPTPSSPVLSAGLSGATSVPWENLHLTGKLVYIGLVVKDNQNVYDIQSLDLQTGEESTIFQAPMDGWVGAAEVSPDSKQVVISYIAPMSGQIGGQQTLYVMPMDGSKPLQLLFQSTSDQDQYYQPEWSPNGKYVYFTRLSFTSSSTSYQVMRVAYPNGKIEKLAEQAYWPRPSEDGAQLVYVTLDPLTSVNHLFLANADGSAARQIPLTGAAVPKVIDASMISPDSQSIIFSAPDLPQSSVPTWMDKLLGISVAFADGNIPSDWWLVSVTGGEPRQLTHTQSLALYGSYSPDNRFIASDSANGIFVMKPDGTGVTQLLSTTGGNAATVDWIP